MKFSEAVILILFLLGGISFFFYFQSGQADKSIINGDTIDTDSSIIQYETTDMISVVSPEPNQLIESPLVIEGHARGLWFFEASFPVILLDANNNRVTESFIITNSDWMTTDFIPFHSELEFENPGTDKGTLILKKDNPSGIAEYERELRIPVRFAKPEMMTIKVFFNNSEYDPDFMKGESYPVERFIPKTQAIASAAINELLKGPSEQEKAKGFFTSINQDVKIQKLSIENGVARIDFNNQIEFHVGGSARVSAISDQITRTLRQFPTVQEVIISVDGRTEDILQP